MARKKKKTEPVDEPAEDRDDDRDEREDADDESPKVAPPRNDAYVGLLAITFLALATAATLLYLDAEALAGQSLAAPTFTVPSLGGGQAITTAE